MRVAIAGAGAVGRSVAATLLEAGHQVLLIEHRRPNYQPRLVPEADWMLADACEVESLRAAGIHTCDVVVAAAGDDKANLVFSLLAKTEFEVPRVVARVNRPDNRWLFTESWGIDVAVSAPHRLVAAVEEAVIVGQVVRLMSLQQERTCIVEITLPANSNLAGTQVSALELPDGAMLMTILRDREVMQPRPEFNLEAHDELVLLTAADVEDELRATFHEEHRAEPEAGPGTSQDRP